MAKKQTNSSEKEERKVKYHDAFKPNIEQKSDAVKSQQYVKKKIPEKIELTQEQVWDLQRPKYVLYDTKEKPSSDTRTSAQRNADYWDPIKGASERNKSKMDNGKHPIQGLAKTVGTSALIATGALELPALATWGGLGARALVGGAEGLGYGNIGMSTGNAVDDFTQGVAGEVGIPLVLGGLLKGAGVVYKSAPLLIKKGYKEIKVPQKINSIFNDINTKHIVSRLSNPKIDRFSDSYTDMYGKLKSDIISGRKKLSDSDLDALFKNNADYEYMKSINNGTHKKSATQEFTFNESRKEIEDLININGNKDVNHPRFNEFKDKLDDDDILHMQSNNAQSQDVANYINARKQKIYNESLNKSDAESILFHNYKDEPAPKGFKSELNWVDFVKKYNKSYDVDDIKNIKLNKKEYDSMEFQSKNDGTWMKYPDGADFDGTPYQFIQSNSKNFKNAFGETSLRNKSGYPMKLYHGNRTGVEFNEFKPPSELGNKFQQGTMTDETTDHTFFSTGRLMADGYNRRSNANNIPIIEVYANAKSIYTPKNYELLANPKKYGISSDEFDAISMIDRFGKNMGDIKIDEVALPTKRIFPKSALGNNGMFDLTKRNRFKVLIPAAGSYGLYGLFNKQGENMKYTSQFKLGGTLKLMLGTNH